MLSPRGRLKGDLTLLDRDDGTFWSMGSCYLREWHLRWFHRTPPAGVTITDISDAMTGLALAGPQARAVLERVAGADLSDAALPFMAARAMDVGPTRARVGRLSVTGELGYEISVPAAGHVALRRTLAAAGRDPGRRAFGYDAPNALRLERSFGIWSAGFTRDRTPVMTGLDRWIDRGKDFAGREAVGATDADASGWQPVWRDGRRVGHVTAGGYGHHGGLSPAMAMVEPGCAAPGTALSVHVLGGERPARVIPPSPHDPEGCRMRK